ncbi:MAG: bifunctional UDP-N-acetylmuramoyl-tripeptide:D-alanyl-D-alanine ligase/alanine racemase [Flavitalea sp.]
MQYQVSEIASILKGKLIASHPDAVISELVMDSRKTVFPESSLFFALRGTRRNGHTFIGEAYRKGIRNFVITETSDTEYPEANFILVKDALDALQCLAAHHRSNFHIPVIGITGSNGKTIVKEWLNQLLDDHYKIVRSPKSYNSQIGVPLSVWEMDETHTLAIFEAGISQSGEMDKLQKIIKPTIGIFTNIGDAHSGGFLHSRQKIKEKLRLFTNVGTIIYRKDYPELNESVASMWRQLKTGSENPFEIFSWSSLNDADLHVKAISKKQTHTDIAAEYKDAINHISIPFTDDASIENAINCWCLLLHLGIPQETIAAKMQLLQAVAMRLEVRDGINNSSLINDSYSADLSSLKIALDFLAQQHQHPKRTVILTDFLESGRSEKELYADIAASLIQHGVDRFIGIGTVISKNQSLFQYNKDKNPGNARPPLQQVQFFQSVEEFRTQFPRMHFANETILIKGARIFSLEEINGMLEKQTHQTVLEIDLNALLHNFHSYQQILQPTTKVMAMVKAFSYGSGSYEVAAALQFNKVDWLAVAYADEGVDLRTGGITLPVMVMNPDVASFRTIVGYTLEPEMYSLALIRSFDEFLKKEGLSQYPIHIEVETGMNRLGFAYTELDELIEILKGNSFKVQSVFSHLVASEDESLDWFTYKQGDHFQYMSSRIQENLSYPVIRHLLNSSGITRHPSLQYDMVRMGIGLYGIDSANKLELQEVSTLKTAIAQIKQLQAGESVSYGRSGIVQRNSRIATVRLGYADGYPRTLGNGHGHMLIRGQLAPTIGHICMDMTMLDITDLQEVNEEDEVVVFGKGLSVAKIAKQAGTIPYEILTGVSQRVKRVYFQE